jgi:hypothetical protein
VRFVSEMPGLGLVQKLSRSELGHLRRDSRVLPGLESLKLLNQKCARVSILTLQNPEPELGHTLEVGHS